VTADAGETPAGTVDAGTAVDLTAAPELAAADVSPELKRLRKEIEKKEI